MANFTKRRPDALESFDDDSSAQLEAILGGRGISRESTFACSPTVAARVTSNYRGLCVQAGFCTLLGVVGFGLVGTVLNWDNRGAGTNARSVTKLVTVATPCSAEGEGCHLSKCCKSGGGEAGLQCWSKNDYWAECLRNITCNAGVQFGETQGTYDGNGVFKLDKWKCGRLGIRSPPACSIYTSVDKCPFDRCDWFHTGKCLEKCDRLSATKSNCPDSHCVWDGSTCKLDACSALGEDCRNTRCCSSGRGAAGRQCFMKNEDWATCTVSCGNESNRGWSCKNLGSRTQLPPPCSWIGEDCSRTRCCGNVGVSCVVRNENYTGCVQTNRHGTWYDQPIPLPMDWEGTEIGKWQEEFAIQSSGHIEPIADVSLFCFMAVLPHSQEEQLVEVARNMSQGIFACNESALFHSHKTIATAWATGYATFQNSKVFFKVWEEVKRDGRYMKYAWTVKVDPDCAFLPNRLRQHISKLRVPSDAAVYIKNTDADPKLSNDQFLGAIEVISRLAVMAYFDNADMCQKTMGTRGGEDGFVKGCLDALGVGYMHDGSILKPDFSASYCQTKERVAFHPLKDVKTLANCYRVAQGEPIDWSHITAPRLPQ